MHTVDYAGTSANRFATAQNVSDVIDRLAAGAALRESGVLGPDQVQQLAAEAKQRLVELGVANFG